MHIKVVQSSAGKVAHNFSVLFGREPGHGSEKHCLETLHSFKESQKLSHLRITLLVRRNGNKPAENFAQKRKFKVNPDDFVTINIL